VAQRVRVRGPLTYGEGYVDLGGLPVPLQDWFLTSDERDNGDSDVPTWIEGNHAEPLPHGATYFDRLVTEVEALEKGDHLFFTDWRGDPDERMRDHGPPPSAASPSRA
jgi:hypothetical protein